MTIKNTLLLLSFVLVGLVIFLAGKNFIARKNVYDNAVFASKTGPVIDELLFAAGNWAVERGVTNSALAGAGRASQEMTSKILERREKADHAFSKAMKMLETIDFQGKDVLVNATKAEYENLITFRAEVDGSLQKLKVIRNDEVMKGWVPAMTKLILTSQELRFIVGEAFSESDSKLSAQTRLKQYTWAMSEYAGRERAIIGGLLSSGSAMTPQKHEELALYRGHVESAWNGIKKVTFNDNDKGVNDAVKAVGDVFFGKFQNVRKGIYDAGINGQAYQIGAKEWIGLSTEAIDTILDVQQAALDETHHYIDDLMAYEIVDLIVNSLIMILALVIGGVAFVVIMNKVINPLSNITVSMNALAEGDTSIDILGLKREDEIGEMAKAVGVFLKNEIEAERLREEKSLQEEEKLEHSERIQEMASSFDKNMTDFLKKIGAATAALTNTSKDLVSLSDTGKGKSHELEQASKIASENVSSVAGASEEMMASINEINMQINKASNISADAVTEAQEAGVAINELAGSSEKIGEVVVLIQDIAEQTNLLALNATIEAARAGESGKGFAVVASEVKSLAAQTANATEDISKQINSIQGATNRSVEVIEKIGRVINEVNEIATSIASAMEEQSGVIQEIVQNTQSASEKTDVVGGIASTVSESAQDTQKASFDVSDAANDFKSRAEELRGEVETFLSNIKAKA